MSPNLNLSPAMEKSLRIMDSVSIPFELIELEWSRYWKPLNKMAPRIRNDTMMALYKRGLVEILENGPKKHAVLKK
ncbi:MAG: hypothetical protein Q4P17_07610 [Methanobacterium sp.]|nr:hypothetical protein [Methanobacterium sp.]